MYFKLNYEYYLHIFYKKDIDLYFRSKEADKLIKKLRNFMAVCRKNLQYAQELQKQAHKEETKPKSYVFGEKI